MNTGPHRIRCLICGGRGGYWSGEFRETCSTCAGTGWQHVPDYIYRLVADAQDLDGFTPEVSL